jgi:hypothetical protein
MSVLKSSFMIVENNLDHSTRLTIPKINKGDELERLINCKEVSNSSKNMKSLIGQLY